MRWEQQTVCASPGSVCADIFHSLCPTSISLSTGPLCEGGKGTFLLVQVHLKILTKFPISLFKIGFGYTEIFFTHPPFLSFFFPNSRKHALFLLANQHRIIRMNCFSSGIQKATSTNWPQEMPTANAPQQCSWVDMSPQNEMFQSSASPL